MIAPQRTPDARKRSRCTVSPHANRRKRNFLRAIVLSDGSGSIMHAETYSRRLEIRTRSRAHSSYTNTPARIDVSIHMQRSNLVTRGRVDADGFAVLFKELCTRLAHCVLAPTPLWQVGCDMRSGCSLQRARIVPEFESTPKFRNRSAAQIQLIHSGPYCSIVGDFLHQQKYVQCALKRKFGAPAECRWQFDP